MNLGIKLSWTCGRTTPAKMLDKLGPVLWTALALLAAYLVQTLRRWRHMRFDQFADFPQLGPPSFFWGHMKLLDEMFRRGDPRRHIGV